MFDPAQHDAAFSRPHLDNFIPVFDPETPLPHQKELVLQIVLVPGKLALDLDQLDFMTVQRSDHLWPPMFVKQAEFPVQVDLVHRSFGRTNSTSLPAPCTTSRQRPTSKSRIANAQVGNFSSSASC